MAQVFPFRLILDVPAEGDLLRRYDAAVRTRQTDDLEAWLEHKGWAPERPYVITALPSFATHFKIGPAFGGRDWPNGLQRRSLVIGLATKTREAARRFYERMAQTRMVSTDIELAGHDSWCPASAAPPFFQTRMEALKRIHADALPTRCDGGQVNVLVVDEGFDAARLGHLFPGFAFGGGFEVNQPGLPPRLPGKAAPDGHGTMVARNILSLAPKATLFDLPLLPDRIAQDSEYMVWAHGVFERVVAAVTAWRDGGLVTGRWVFCNAWGIYSRRSETIPGDYTNNPAHPFNALVAAVDALGWVDQVFAAGNCGVHCPNAKCGADDRGPGHSILGANSHPGVLTVGATRTDLMRLGYSSQGPGQPGFLPAGGDFVRKPDLSAPSHFVEPGDAVSLHSGTSAACGLVAGAIAALRSTLTAPTPAELRDRLRRTAAQQGLPGWNRDLGHGVLDLRAALDCWP